MVPRGAESIWVVALSLCLGAPAAPQSATVWIKDTASDTSGWPFGFPHVPQPASENEVCKIDGSETSDLDTAFDATMREKANPHTTVHLGPGLFKTRGAVGNTYAQSYRPGFRLQTDSRLIGSGKRGHANGGTTLLLAACNDHYGGLVVGANQFDYWDDSWGFRDTTASDIWVTDLEIDCNGPELTKVPGSDPPRFDPRGPWNIQGVQLWGTGGCHIERVHVKRAVSADNVPPIVENFILCINSPPGISVGNVIKDCSVTEFHNPTGFGGCSAISMNRWDEGAGSIQGIISGCEVVLNGERGWGFGGEFAYNASTAWGLVITNCTSRGAQRGFNDDTFPNYCLSMAGNYFEMPPGISYGIALFKANYWSRFHQNTIVLKSAWSSGIILDKAASGFNNTLIDHNTFIVTGKAWTGVSWPFNLNDGLLPELIPAHVHLQNNQILNDGPSARIVNLVPPQVGYMAGNKVNGTEALWPVPQPNPGWTYSPMWADLLNDGTLDVVLQDPAQRIFSYSVAGETVQTPIVLVPSRALQGGWQVVGAGDINVDGQTDLFLNHAEFGLGYWLMQGNVCVQAGAITSQGQPCILSGTWGVAGVADFNRDGKPDLLLQDEEGRLGVWRLHGTEVQDTVLLQRNRLTGLSFRDSGNWADDAGTWRAAATGDFNGDGHADILFQYDLETNARTDGQLAVWFMEGIRVTRTAVLDPVRPADRRDRVVAAGPFSRSGAVDILFQRKERRGAWGGSLTLWAMDPRNGVRLAKAAPINPGISRSFGSRNVVGPP